jgi:excinuclease UvrABC ATPase subunit
MNEDIIIEGIETNNLKDINIKLKKKAINLIIGPSGSGKSSLAYDTIAQIGQHEFLSMFADNVSEPTYKVKSFCNMVAAVPIKQSNFNNNLRSTIGTYFGMNRSIGFIYAVLLGISEDIFVLNKESNLCGNCHGLGTISVLDEIRIVNYNLPIGKNPFRCWNRYKDFYSQILEKYCNDCGIDSNKTFKELSDFEKNKLLFGESENKYSIRYKKTNSFSRRTTKFYGVMTGNPMLINHSIGKKFYSEKICPCCEGKKYSKQYEQYKVDGLSIGEFMISPFSEISKVLKNIIKKIDNDKLSFTLNMINNFVEKAIELNLGHLFFHRAIPTLSGGELQRLRMVQVFNTQLSDLLIVLDEPLAGLSGKEKDCLFKNVIELSGNHTVVVVDHSEKFVGSAAKIIALGEEGGHKGGFLIDNKKFLEEQRKCKDFYVPEIKHEIIVRIENSVYKYNGVNICIAEKCMNLITGYSGVGKSTLLREYFPQFFEKYVYINQKPLLGNKNSTVATTLDISGRISEVFAKKFSKNKKFFSNLTGNDGMCPVCQGAGYLEYGIDKSLLTKLECQECEGTGFNINLKKYKIAEKSIFNVWKMTISEAILYYASYDKKIVEILDKASSIMLGHLRIGQSTATLSGGENIRIKILKSSKTTANVLGIDEPFKGLSKTEIYKVAKYIDVLRNSGKTIVVIDHTDDVSKYFSKKIVLKNEDNQLISTNPTENL